MERADVISSGVELCFLDQRNGRLLLTGRLYGNDPAPTLCYTLNGEKREADLGASTEISHTYRHIFKIELDLSKLNSVRLSFEANTVCGPFFPIEFKCNGYSVIGEYIVYNESSTVIIEKCTKELLKQRKRKYKVFSFKKDALIAFAIRVFNRLLKPFCKKELWLISDRIDRAGDNGQAFFEYVVKNTPKGVKPVFLLDKKSPDYKKMKKIGKVKSPVSPFYKVYYTLASKHISSQLDGSRLLKVRAYLKDILNKQDVVFLQHGVIEHDSSSYYNRFDFGMDMFVTTTNGEYGSIVGIESYGCDDTVTQLVGLCRHDKLKNERENIIFIAPSWRLGLLTDTETREIKEGFENSTYYKIFNGLLNSERLIAKAMEKGYKICFYPHRMMEKAKHFFKTSHPVFINGDSISYTEMFCKGAMLITDFSSVQFDFAYLKKPLIYCQADKAEFFAAHTCTEGYMDYERDGFGPICNTLDSLVDTICEYMDNDCQIKEMYLERIEKTFKFTDGKSCERTLERIMEL
ncbi:MAG: CDP-glycerol glycerophosphotransferase family protein [Clostridia bacterium]|nr:CDP-glycerol glycerophosphotransferase family protein [Clostridia bacterium]